MNRKRFSAVVGACAGVLTVALSSTAANAAPVPPSNTGCPSNKLCFYDAEKFRGMFEIIDAEALTYKCDSAVSNGITAISNRTNIGVYVYTSANCGGGVAGFINPQTANDNIGPVLNDRIRSISRTAFT